MPFKSEAQRGWMHANKPEMAEKWEKETPKGKKLPKKVKKKAKSESIDKIIDTALAEAEIKRRKRSWQKRTHSSEIPSFYMSSKSYNSIRTDSPRRYIATGINASYHGDAGQQGGCLDVDLISTLSKRFTKYAIEYAAKHGYEIVPDENGSLRGEYCGDQLSWPIKRPDKPKARQEHFESQLDSILEDQNCILTVLSEDYDDYEKGEDWSADEDQSNFHDIDSVVPVTRLPHGVFAYKGMPGEAEYAIGQRTIPRFVAISDNNHIKCASWCPSEQIVYKFQIPNLSEKSPQPISVISWHGDCTTYPKGMPAVFHNNQYKRAAPSSAPEHYDELVISVPCVVVDKYEPIGEDGNDFLFRNSNGDELIWSI